MGTAPFLSAPPMRSWSSASWTNRLSSWITPFFRMNMNNNKNKTANTFSFPPLCFYSTYNQPSVHPSTSHQTHISKFKPLHDALKKHQVIGDVVDDFTPSVDLQVSFPKGTVKDGNIFTASDLHYVEPDVKWSPADKNTFYTLVKVDPDAPSRENHYNREWRHWLVVNIPGSDISKGEVLAPYAGPHPSKGSGLHRYVFLLYKQQDRIFFPSMDNTGTHRGNWRVKEFTKQYDLGSPVGSAFYQAEY